MLRLIKGLKDRVQGKAPKGCKRSPQWSDVRKAFIKQNPSCAVCGGTRKVEVHHMVPFHMDPSRELDPTNLISLCERKKYGITCHQFFGHLGNYKGVNISVKEDAEHWKQKLEDSQKQLADAKQAAQNLKSV